MPQGPVDVHSNLYASNINKHTIAEFHYNLIFESWKSVFYSDNVNKIFNTFLNTLFKNFIYVFLS
jgi:hypothetical protein